MRPAIVTFTLNLALLLVAIPIGGGGHGILLPIALLSGPFLFFNSPFVIVLALLFWTAAGYATQHWPKYVFPLLMLVSYSSFVICFVLNFRDEFFDPYRDIAGQWHQFASWLVAFAALYLSEQFGLWRWWIRRPA